MALRAYKGELIRLPVQSWPLIGAIEAIRSVLYGLVHGRSHLLEGVIGNC